MAPPRPKREYEERGADDDGTPMQRFERLVRRVVAVPKKDVDARDQIEKERGKTA